MKRILVNLAVGAMALAVCVFVLEIASRLAYSHLATYNTEMWRYASKVKQRTSNPELPFHHAPHRSGQFYGAEITTNAFGFRDREYPVARTPGRRRIIMLGESFTLGWGVALADTYSKQLERLLNESGDSTEVINLGVGNYNTVMELALFRAQGQQFEPDQIILMHYINDLEPTPKVVSPLKAAILTRSYLLALLSDRYIKLKPVLSGGYDWRAYYGGLYDPNAPGYAPNRKALVDLIALCRERGIALLIASIPELRELKDYPFPQAIEFPRAIAAEHKIPFVNLLPDLVDQPPESLWVTVEDPHANGKANGIIAQALFQRLRKR